MGMDLLRSCYYSRMAIYRDRPDIMVAGSWHFSPPGAKVLPFMHGFGSGQWHPEDMILPPLLPPRGAKGGILERLLRSASEGAELLRNTVSMAARGTLLGAGEPCR